MFILKTFIFFYWICQLAFSQLGGYNPYPSTDLAASLEEDPALKMAVDAANQTFYESQASPLSELTNVRYRVVSGVIFKMVFTSTVGPVEGQVYVQYWTKIVEVQSLKLLPKEEDSQPSQPIQIWSLDDQNSTNATNSTNETIGNQSAEILNDQPQNQNIEVEGEPSQTPPNLPNQIPDHVEETTTNKRMLFIYSKQQQKLESNSMLERSHPGLRRQQPNGTDQIFPKLPFDN